MPIFELSSITKYFPYVPERIKERIDLRRWVINPYWKKYNQDEISFENAHPGYHSRERHGGEHSFGNIHARTQQPGGGGNLLATGASAMTHLGVAVTGYVANGAPLPSGRFSTPAWHEYTRNKAMKHVEVSLGIPALTWPTTPIPQGAAAAGSNTYQFTIEYQGSPAGVSIDSADVVSRANYVRSTIKINAAKTQAWFIQHFPQTTAAAAAVAAIPNTTIQYNQIPWFSVN